MSVALINTASIGDLVEEVATWNPVRDAPDDDFAYIDLSAVDNTTKVITRHQTLLGSEAPSRARQRVRTNDILVSTVRPNLNGVARVPSELDDATASTGFCVLRPTRGIIDPNYLFHWVRSPSFVNEMVRRATGASYPAVTDQVILNSYIPLPSLDEQRRIAAILDQADELRRKRQRAIACLNQLGQALFYEMFGDGSHFDQRALKAVGTVSTGSTPPTGDEESFGGPIPFVTPGDLGSGEDVKRRLSESGVKKSRTVRSGATFVCCIGATIGKMGQSSELSAFNQQINAIEWGNKIEPTYGFFAVQRIRAAIIHKGKGASTTLPILKKSEFEKLEIACPPLTLQGVFADRVNAIRQQAYASKMAFGNLEKLFQALQHRAFRGEL